MTLHIVEEKSVVYYYSDAAINYKWKATDNH